MSAGKSVKLEIQWICVVFIGFLFISFGGEEITKQNAQEVKEVTGVKGDHEAAKISENEVNEQTDTDQDANVLSTGGRAKPPSQTHKNTGPSTDPPKKIIEQPQPPTVELPAAVEVADVEGAELKENDPSSNQEVSQEAEESKQPVIEEHKDEREEPKETKLDLHQIKEESSPRNLQPNDETTKDDEVKITSEIPPSNSSEVEEDGKEEEEVLKEEAIVEAEEEDMVSFDEWKKKRLAEQAEQERKDGSSKSPTSTPSQSKVKTSKNRINFGSATCGAKILTSNNGAQNPSYLLSENKDQYMINSCKAKKWFIVELCEPVQVHSIEIGNLELFSSLPQEFAASISDRYPTKDWKPLGVFHAREERSIQSFSVRDNQMYAKYLKVEMSTHYGHEHFCTLSILRVFGATVVDDDDDHDDEPATVTETDPDPEISDEMLLEQDSEGKNLETADEKKNLFTSATDSVLSLVKTVLSPPAEVDQKSLEDVKEGIAHNVSTKNVTPPVEKEEQAAPCPPDARVDSDVKPEEAEKQHDSLPDVPQPTVDAASNECFVISETVVPTEDAVEPKEEIAIVTMIDPKDYPKEEEPNVLIRLIEKPKTLAELLTDCAACSDLDSGDHFSARTSTSCAYHALWWRDKKPLLDVIQEPVVEAESRAEDLQPSIAITSTEEAQSTETPSEDVTEPVVTPVVATESGVSNVTTTKVEVEAATPVLSKETPEAIVASEEKVIFAEENGDLHLESVPPPNADEMQYQKLGSRGKETLLMRLKNRVTDLELNLSLSSRYLEELSQRYKRQMEEMYRSLNKTITKFSNVTKSTEQRGTQQQGHIQDLQVQLSNITAQLLRLESSMQNLSTSLVERQFTFLFIEVIVFAVILSVCLGRRRGTGRQEEAPPELVEVKRSGHMRTASLDVSPNRGRGASFNGLSRARTDTEKTRSGSDGDLNIIPLNPVLVPNLRDFDSNRNNNRTKKKKRKSNPFPASILTGDKVSQTRRYSEAPMASTQHSPSAGVIFNPVHNKSSTVKSQLSFAEQNGQWSSGCQGLRKSKSMEKEPVQRKRCHGKVRGEMGDGGVHLNGHHGSNGTVEDVGYRRSYDHRRNIDSAQ